MTLVPYDEKMRRLSLEDRLALQRMQTGRVDFDGPRCEARCPDCGAPCNCPKNHVTLTTTNHVGAYSNSARCCFFGAGTLMPKCGGNVRFPREQHLR